MTVNFLIVLTVSALFLIAMCTASYNDDKTKGM